MLTDFDEQDLMDGDVTVRVEYTALNYKDGLALTGKAPVVRRIPMIAGIDFGGAVAACGLGEGGVWTCRQASPRSFSARCGYWASIPLCPHQTAAQSLETPENRP